MNDKTVRDTINLAWKISPILAVYLPDRLHSSEVMSQELSKLIRNNYQVKFKSKIHISAYFIIIAELRKKV